MRKGFPGALGVLLAGTTLVFAQAPYGYGPAQPYTAGYGYPGYGYGYAPGYGTDPAPSPAAGYAPGYGSGYPPGYGPGFAPGYPVPYTPQPSPAPLSPAGTEKSSLSPVRRASAQTFPPNTEQLQVPPTEGPAADTLQQTPGQAKPGAPPEELPSIPGVPAKPATPGTPSPGEPKAGPPSTSPAPSAPQAPSASTPGAAAPTPASQPGEALPSTPIPGELTDHPAATAAGSGSDCCGAVDGCYYCDRQPRCWGSGEWLYWKVKSAPQPPLVTVGDTALAGAAGATPGALGAPGTSVLNPGSVSYPVFSGGRMTLGTWLTSSRTFGLEASAFTLQRKSDAFTAGTPGGATSVLAIPFFDPVAGAESALIIAAPGLSTATVSIQNQLQLWGAEMNSLYGIMNNNWFSFRVLSGLRYLDLKESLELSGNSAGIPGGAFDGLFYNFTDRFATRNQFYGAQVGARAELRYDRFFVNVTGKVAVGPMQESVTINGVTTTNFPAAAATVTTPAGVFAQGTNIGHHSQSEVAVVPEFQAQIGWQPYRWLRFFGGYNIIYASNVLRPGDQIDRSVNPALLASLAAGTVPTLTFPYSPETVVFHSSSFWAQGVSLGCELRY